MCELLWTINEHVGVLCNKKCHRLMRNLPRNCGFCATKSPNFIMMDSKHPFCILAVRRSFWDIVLKDRVTGTICLAGRRSVRSTVTEGASQKAGTASLLKSIITMVKWIKETDLAFKVTLTDSHSFALPLDFRNNGRRCCGKQLTSSYLPGPYRQDTPSIITHLEAGPVIFFM